MKSIFLGSNIEINKFGHFRHQSTGKLINNCSEYDIFLCEFLMYFQLVACILIFQGHLEIKNINFFWTYIIILYKNLPV
jgi:hypothetical protein